MKTNYKIIRLLILFIIIIFMPGCRSQGSWPKSVPAGNIIFQSNVWDPYEINIIQEDGTNHQIVKLPGNFVRPHWSADGKFLLGLSNPTWKAPHDESGFPSYWKIISGEFQICGENPPFFYDIQEYLITEDQFEVIVSIDKGISVFDLNNCEHTKMLVDYSEIPGKFSIQGISYNPKSKMLVYGESTVPVENREYKIISKNLATGEQEELAEGINPSWSPDGRTVAFVGYDGLYLLNMESKITRLLVEYGYYDPKSYGFGLYSPQPRWSPNGKWLVYHQCTERMCPFESTSIIKVRIEDGYVEEIFKGGKFPSWMP